MDSNLSEDVLAFQGRKNEILSALRQCIELEVVMLSQEARLRGPKIVCSLSYADARLKN